MLRAEANALSTPELGMSSFRSYLPIACAVTRLSMAVSRSLSEKPAAARAILSLCPIMGISPAAPVYNNSVLMYICKLLDDGLPSRLHGKDAGSPQSLARIPGELKAMTANRIASYAPAAGPRATNRHSDQKGIHEVRNLPDSDFDGLWESIVLPAGVKDRLLAQAVLNFTARA